MPAGDGPRHEAECFLGSILGMYNPEARNNYSEMTQLGFFCACIRLLNSVSQIPKSILHHHVNIFSSKRFGRGRPRNLCLAIEGAEGWRRRS